MAEQPDITPEMCRKWLAYDPETGTLHWKSRDAADFTASPKRSAAHMAANWNACFAGKLAFTAVKAKGYPFGTINRRVAMAHQVI